jgi:hypothetical protein
VRNFVYPSSSGFDSLGFLFHCLLALDPVRHYLNLSCLICPSDRAAAAPMVIISDLPATGWRPLSRKKKLIRHFAGNMFNRPPRFAHRTDWS